MDVSKAELRLAEREFLQKSGKIGIRHNSDKKQFIYSEESENKTIKYLGAQVARNVDTSIRETMKICDKMAASSSVKEILTLQEDAKLKLFSAFFVNSIICRLRPLILCLDGNSYHRNIRLVKTKVLNYANKVFGLGPYI